jgi:hypothetical protein
VDKPKRKETTAMKPATIFKALGFGFIAFGAVLSPQIMEGTSNNCAALERLSARKFRDYNNPPYLDVLAHLSDGRVATMERGSACRMCRPASHAHMSIGRKRHPG